MESSRTVLELEDSSRTQNRGLGLGLEDYWLGLGLGLGLEHAVLEPIPAGRTHNNCFGPSNLRSSSRTSVINLVITIF